LRNGARARGGSACGDSGGDVVTMLSVRQAQANDAAVVSGVLSEANAWLRTRGQPLWEPAQLMTSELRAEVEAGKYIVCSEGDVVVGVARLTEDDLTFWPDALGAEAFYVHQLAVRRSHAGKGVSLALLDWSGKRAAAAARAK
jgi:predicted N-acetyltransferase YhbS